MQAAPDDGGCRRRFACPRCRSTMPISASDANVADKRIIQRTDRRQPAGALKYKWAWQNTWPAPITDAAGGEYEPRHQTLWKSPNGLTEDERRIKPQPRLFVTADSPGRQQHRAGHLPAHHRPECRHTCRRARGRNPPPRLSVHRRVSGPGRESEKCSIPQIPIHP